MAKVTTTATKAYSKPKVSRPGTHAKTKSSKSKKSRNYKKSYRAQGR